MINLGKDAEIYEYSLDCKVTSHISNNKQKYLSWFSSRPEIWST